MKCHTCQKEFLDNKLIKWQVTLERSFYNETEKMCLKCTFLILEMCYKNGNEITHIRASSYKSNLVSICGELFRTLVLKINEYR